MHIVSNDGATLRRMSPRQAAREADRHAAMLELIYLDIEDLDPGACPPDRRYVRKDKQAWVYDHGNVCELVFVRTDEI